MATQTPNYNFDLPVVGGDENTWGTFLNGNWSSLDTELKVIDDKFPLKLDVAGGTLTGDLSIDGGNLVINNEASDFITLQRDSTMFIAFKSDDDSLTRARLQVGANNLVLLQSYDAAGSLQSQLGLSNANLTLTGTGIDATIAGGSSVLTADRADTRYVRTDEDDVLTQGYGNDTNDLGDLAGAVNITPEGGNFQKGALTGDVTLGTAGTGGASYSVVLLLDNAGGNTVTIGADWDAVTGDSVGTGNYLFYITRLEGIQTVHVQKV